MSRVTDSDIGGWTPPSELRSVEDTWHKDGSMTPCMAGRSNYCSGEAHFFEVSRGKTCNFEKMSSKRLQAWIRKRVQKSEPPLHIIKRIVKMRTRLAYLVRSSSFCWYAGVGWSAVNLSSHPLGMRTTSTITCNMPADRLMCTSGRWTWGLKSIVSWDVTPFNYTHPAGGSPSFLLNVGFSGTPFRSSPFCIPRIHFSSILFPCKEGHQVTRGYECHYADYASVTAARRL